jgi:hypothetical protein
MYSDHQLRRGNDPDDVLARQQLLERKLLAEQERAKVLAALDPDPEPLVAA